MWARTAARKGLRQAEEEQAQQNEALLTIINALQQAIFTVSEQGKVRLYNAAFLSLIDTNESLSGKAIDDVLPLYGADNEPASLYNMMKKLTNFERDDLVLRFPDGESIRLGLSVNRIQSTYSADHPKAGRGYVCIARDITKEKSLDEERDEFISVVSHELRTPVTIAEGTLSNVQYFIQNGAAPNRLDDALKDAHDQIVLLSNMINDLGTLSRAERGVGDQLEELNIRALVEDLYKKYRSSAEKKGLKLDLDAGPRLGKIITSRLYLEETLQNLIINAIKYTQTGSVTIRARRSTAGVEFAVHDTGIGIGKADLKHIFEKFYRSEDYRTRETSGTGLGLYVVAKLMQKLGTRAEVTSRLNHGSTFSFVLPEKTPKS
jgi:two-component system sensor histidine kinase ResE